MLRLTQKKTTFIDLVVSTCISVQSSSKVKGGGGEGKGIQYEQKYRNISRQYNLAAERRARSRNGSKRSSPLTLALSLLPVRKSSTRERWPPYNLCP
jgi:hypothetical protein